MHKEENFFWISKELEEEIRIRLSKKEQSIIFINRRGHSFFIQCKECGTIENCINCSVSLTLHDDGTAKCHYCNFFKKIPIECSSCKAKQESLLKKGIGTQQVTKMLQQLFPKANIARADLDTTINKKNFQEIVEKMHSGELDILVGTQTITKGYHFPKVTLVGLIWADVNLGMPFYNAAEISLQQIIQVAGRAGRESQKSTVIVQSILDHPLFNYINEIDYLKYFHYEINCRKDSCYPPFTRLFELEIKNGKENILEIEVLKIAQILKDFENNNLDKIKVLGPVNSIIYKLKNSFSKKIYIKSQSYKSVISAINQISYDKFKSKIAITPNILN